jgi:hypothetical protein
MTIMMMSIPMSDPARPSRPTPVNVTRAVGGAAGAENALATDLARVRQLAKLLDAKFELAGVRFGWDAVIGLVPVVGDVVTGLIAVYPIHIARKHKLSGLTQARMTANVLLDWAIGAVPLVGDLFDVAFKANLKNLALLEKAVEQRRLE